MSYTIRHIERIGRTVNGNPRARIVLEDQDGNYSTHLSQSDAGFMYGIDNPENKGPVNVTFTKAGRISNIKPAEAGTL